MQQPKRIAMTMRGLIPALWLVLGFSTSVMAGPMASQFDQYLELVSQDPAKARAFLQQMANQPANSMAPDDHCRLIAYRLADAREAQAAEQTSALEQQLDQTLAANPTIDCQAELSLEKYWLLKQRQDHQAAELLFTEIERLAAQTEDLRVRYWLHLMLGSELQNRNRFPEALKSTYIAYQTLENYPHPRTPIRMMAVASTLISLNINQRNFDEASRLVKEAIQRAEADAKLGNYIADLYRQKASIEAELNDYPAAERSLLHALDVGKKYPGTDMFILQNNLGDALMKQGKLDKAVEVFEQARTIAEKMSYVDGIVTAQFNIGSILVQQGKLPEGIDLMAAMVKKAEQMNQPDIELISYYQEIADAYHQIGQYQLEADFLRKQALSAKRMFQADRDQQVSALQEQFSAQQKAREIETLKQKNALNESEIEKKQLQQRVFLLIGLVLCLVAVLLFMLYRKVQSANALLKKANDQLAYSSTHDPLTGLLNRRSLHDYMHKRETIGERRQTKVAETDGFILLDVDYFKHINDHYGHMAGDAVLIELGNRLKTLTRGDDMVLRWGGEEFLILLRRIDQQALYNFAQRVLNTIGSEPVMFEGKAIPVTASAGFITLPFDQVPEQELNWEKALQMADMALYLGKVHGRNRGYGFARLLKPYHEIRPQLEQDLSKAVEHHQVEMSLVLGPNATP